MYYVVLKDSGKVLAQRRSLEAAKQAARKRAATCPAKIIIINKEPG
jgi:hypothetical protein